MRIICPNCAAQYEVLTQRLPAGRKVRCAHCNTLWRVSTDSAQTAPAPAAPAPAAPVPLTPDPALPEPRPAPAVETAHLTAGTHRPNWGPKLGWAVSIMVLAILCAAVIHWRAEVIRIWPPSGRILASASSAHTEHIGNDATPQVTANVTVCVRFPRAESTI